MDAYDAIVVGAGPAGSAAAYDLASWGRSVLLLDRCDFPRLKPCAGALTIKALKALRYPVTPVIQRVFNRAAILKESRVSCTFASRHPFCVMTVRSEFDYFCLRQTIAAGARFRRIEHWTAIEESPESVVIHTSEGTFAASFLIGADGANSQVRHFCGSAPWSFQGFALETTVPRDHREFEMQFDFGVVPGGYGWIFPKRDHFNLGLYTFAPHVQLTRAHLHEYVRKRIGPTQQGRVVGHKIGFGGWDYKPESRRVFLVGDAAGLVDALLGEGIYNAIKSGQAAASAIEGELRGGEPAQKTFATLLRPIQKDVSLCHRAANRFYADMERGYAALTSAIIRYSLLKGYSMGLTFHAIKNWFFALPLFPVASVADLLPEGSSSET